MPECYLMLGSNLGNRGQNLKQSIEKIEKFIGAIIKKSAVYESEPWGYEDSLCYYNQVIYMRTSLDAIEVLCLCLSIEDSLGRIRKKNSYEARTIDIDLLFYGDLILNSTELVLPHPRIAERKFVLLPICEISPTLIHPVSGKTLIKHLGECEDKSWVKRMD